MPAFRFLYEKRRISGETAGDAVNFVGDDRDKPEMGWEIVPTYEARCLVAYLMSLDQSHELKEVKSTVSASAAAPGTSRRADYPSDPAASPRRRCPAAATLARREVAGHGIEFLDVKRVALFSGPSPRNEQIDRACYRLVVNDRRESRRR
jgi:hypothetical protein